MTNRGMNTTWYEYQLQNTHPTCSSYGRVMGRLLKVVLGPHRYVMGQLLWAFCFVEVKIDFMEINTMCQMPKWSGPVPQIITPVTQFCWKWLSVCRSSIQHVGTCNISSVINYEYFMLDIVSVWTPHIGKYRVLTMDLYIFCTSSAYDISWRIFITKVDFITDIVYLVQTGMLSDTYYESHEWYL